MAKGNRCYLCGGKLSRGRCVECGLDNYRMTRRNYRLNVTTPYHVKQQQIAARKAENMTYVKAYKQEQASLENYGKPVSQQKKTASYKPINTPTKSNTGPTAYQKQARKAYEQTVRDIGSRVENRKKEIDGSKKKINGAAIAGIIWAIFFLISQIGSCAETTFDTIAEPEEYEAVPLEVVDEYTYEYVTRELSDTGDYYQTELSNGTYIVGVHIPEGTYSLEILEGEYMYANLWDDENSIYISANLGEYAYDQLMDVGDVRMYEGAKLDVSGDGVIRFVSENAQLETMTKVLNPQAEGYSFVNDSMEEFITFEVGEEIPAGFYDLSVTSGWCSVTVYYEDASEEPYTYENYYWLSADNHEDIYENVLLLDGMTVSWEGECISFIPSEYVPTDEALEGFIDTYMY